LNIYISQGSVATQIRCRGIVSDHVISFPQNMPVKNFENQSILATTLTKICG